MVLVDRVATASQLFGEAVQFGHHFARRGEIITGLFWNSELVVVRFEILFVVLHRGRLEVVVPFAIQKAHLLLLIVQYEAVESVEIVAKPAGCLKVERNSVLIAVVDHIHIAVLYSIVSEDGRLE